MNSVAFSGSTPGVKTPVEPDFAKDAREYGNALNEAGWELIAAVNRHTGAPESPRFFNSAKAILRDAILVYAAAVEKERARGVLGTVEASDGGTKNG
jgi:creatinine amidohydrolase/Fe(II)-dependent formamide hydrolase-like protein